MTAGGPDPGMEGPGPDRGELPPSAAPVPAVGTAPPRAATSLGLGVAPGRAVGPAAGPAAGSAAAAAPAPRPGRLRRALRIARKVAVGLVVAVVVLLIVVRAALPSVLPRVLVVVGQKLDLTIRYRELHLELLQGNVELDGLVVEPIEGGDAFLRLGHLRADVALSRLLRGEIVVRRVDVDALEARIERSADGKLVLLDRIEKALARAKAAEPEAEPEPEPEPEPEAEEPRRPRPLELASPVVVEAVRVQHLTVRVIDHAPARPIDETFRLEVRLDDLGQRSAPGRLDVRLLGGRFFDGLRLEGQIGAFGEVATARLAVDLERVRLEALEPVLAPLGIRRLAERLDASLRLEADVARRAAGDFDTLTGELRLAGIALRADGAEVAALDLVRVTLDEVGPRLVRVHGVEVSGIRAAAERTGAGALRAAGFEVGGPPQPGAEVADARAGAAAPSPGPSPSPSPSASPAPSPSAPAPAGPPAAGAAAGAPANSTPPPIVEVGEVRLAGVHLDFHDAAAVPPTDLAIRVTELAVRGFVLDPARPDAEATLAGEVLLPGILQAVTLSGKVRPMAETKRAQIALDVRGLGPERLAAYLPPEIRATLEAMGGLRVDLDAAATPRASGGGADLEARVGLAIGGIAERIEVVARVAGDPKAPSAEIDLCGRGLRLDALEPILGPARVASLLHDGRLDARVRAAATLGDDGAVDAEVALTDLALAEGPVTFVALQRLRVDGLRLRRVEGRQRVELGQLAVEGLAASAWLGRGAAAGRVAAGGVCLGGPLAAPLGDEAAWRELPLAATVTVGPLALEIGPGAPPSTLPLRVEAAVPGFIERVALDVAAQLATLPEGQGIRAGVRAALELSGIQLDALGIYPAAGGDLAVLAAKVDVALDGVEPRAGAPAAPLALTVRLDGILDELRLEGTVVPDPAAVEARLALAMKGLRAGPMAAYLPPGVGLPLADGRLGLGIAASFRAPPGGPPSAQLALSQLRFQDGEAGEPWFELGQVRLDAPSLDAARGIELAEVAVEGIRLRAYRDEEGAVHAFGARLAPPAPAPAAPAPEAAPEPAPEAALAPAAAAGSSGGTGPAEAEVAASGAEAAAARPAAASAPGKAPDLPHVRLGKLRLELREVRFEDRQRGAAPVVVEGLVLESQQPISLFDPEDESPEPIRVRLSGAVRPALGSIGVEVAAEPFADRPRVEVALRLAEMSGAGLLAIAPELREKIDAAGLEGGSFALALGVEATIARAGPLAFLPERGLGVDVHLRDVAYRAVPDGEVLLGLDRLEVALERFDPKTGAMHFRAIEIGTPTLRAKRTKETIEALGFIVRLPAPPPAPEVASGAPDGEGAAGEGAGEGEGADAEGASASAEASEPTPSAPPGDPAEPAGGAAAAPAEAHAAPKPAPPEIVVDRLAVEGLDLRVLDASFDPPVDLHLDALDVEVLGAGTRALTEPLPIRFAIRLAGGPVTLPKRKAQTGGFVGGLVGGMAGGAMGVAGGAADLAGGLFGGMKDLVTGDDEATATSTPAAEKAADEPEEVEERLLFEEISVSGEITLFPRPSGQVKLRVSAVELPAFRGAARAGGIDLRDGLAFVSVDLGLGADGAIALEGGPTLVDLDASEPPGGLIERALGLSAPLNAVIFLIRDDEAAIGLPLDLALEGGKPPGEQLGELASAALAAFGKLIGTAVASSPLRAAGTVLDLGEAGLAIIPGGTALKGLFASDPIEPVVVSFAPGDATFDEATRAALIDLRERLIDDDQLVLEIQATPGTRDLERVARRARPTDAQIEELIAGFLHRLEAAEARRQDLARHAEAAVLFGTPPVAAQALRALRAEEAGIGRLEAALDVAVRLRAEPAERSAARRLRQGLRTLADARAAAIREVLSSAESPIAEDRVRVQRAAGDPVAEGSGQAIVRARAVSSR